MYFVKGMTGNPQILPDGNTDIGIRDFVCKYPMRLTIDEAVAAIPLWTPNGQRVVFYSTRRGEEGLRGAFPKKADRAGEVEKLDTASERMIPLLSWTYNEKALVLSEFITNPLGYNIGTLSIEGGQQRKELLQGRTV